MGQREFIISRFKRLQSAAIQKDSATMETLLDDAYTLQHISGNTQTKDAFIQDVKRGNLSYKEIEYVQFQYTDNGLIADTRVLASVYGSSYHWWNLRQTIIYNDQGKAISCIATTY